MLKLQEAVIHLTLVKNLLKQFVQNAVNPPEERQIQWIPLLIHPGIFYGI